MAEKDNSMREREEEDEERSFQDEESTQPPEEEPPPVQNEAMEEQHQVFPLPGWTERGHQVEQCTDRGGPSGPIWDGAVHTTLCVSHHARTLQPREVFPLPGWTARGHQVQQCNDPGLPPHCPIWGIAERTSSNGVQYPRGPEPQENDCLCDSCRSNHC